MLIIEYDPINGTVIPDGLIKDWADNLVKTSTNMNITVGSSLMIDTTRALIAKKKINHKEIIYRFKKQDLKPDKNGRLSVWPKGFCDTYDDVLEELLWIDSNA